MSADASRTPRSYGRLERLPAFVRNQIAIQLRKRARKLSFLINAFAQRFCMGRRTVFPHVRHSRIRRTAPRVRAADGTAQGHVARHDRARGPDGEGVGIAGHAALGMRRLSIIDIEGGSQPIFNEDRTVRRYAGTGDL